MDVRERQDPYDEGIAAAIDGKLAEVFTMMPAAITKYNPAKAESEVQIGIKAVVNKPDGSSEIVDYPPLQNLKTFQLGGGGYTLNFPHAAGGEGIVLFGSRSLDGWQQSGGVQQQTHSRTHSLSDGVFLPGFYSDPKTTPGSDTHFQFKGPNGFSIQSGADGCTIEWGGMKIIISAGRIDLGGPGGQKVMTEGGPSNKVFAVL